MKVFRIFLAVLLSFRTLTTADILCGGGSGLYVPTVEAVAYVLVADSAGLPFAGATVTLSALLGPSNSDMTAAGGIGIPRLRAADSGYDDLGKCFTLTIFLDDCHEQFSEDYRTPDDTDVFRITKNVHLRALSDFQFNGYVTQRGSGLGLPGTTVIISGPVTMSTRTNTNGRFFIEHIPFEGDYRVTINPPVGWVSQNDPNPLTVPRVCPTTRGERRDYVVSMAPRSLLP